MTWYVATVGNDTAPVALGFLYASQKVDITHALLRPDKPLGQAEDSRQLSLIEWLTKKGVQVATEATGVEPRRLQNGIFNLTGGEKPSALPLLEQAQKAEAVAFTVDAHSKLVVIHDILNSATQQVSQHLTEQDYEQLYLTPEVCQHYQIRRVHTPLPQWAATALSLPPNTYAIHTTAPQVLNRVKQLVDGKPLTAWVVVKDSIPTVIWDAQRLPSQGSEARLRLMARLSRALLGQLAQTIFLLQGQQTANRKQFICQDLKARFLDDQGLHAPEALPALKQTSLDVDDNRTVTSVLVVLMGEQPMPAVLAVQASPNIPERIYLLSTNAVQVTAKRVQQVLEKRSEVGNCLSIVPINEDSPHTILGTLDSLKSLHPQAHLSLNLTGGTKALALHGLLWAQQQLQGRVKVEFTRGKQMHDGRQPRWHLKLEEELALRGAQVISKRDVPKFDPALYKAADALLRGGSEKKLAAFAIHIQRCLPSEYPVSGMEAGLGLAGEYISIVLLNQEFKKLPGVARELWWCTKLEFDSGAEREVDGLAVLRDGRILVLEVKRDLISGLVKDAETHQTPELAERLGGLQAHSLIVGRVLSHRAEQGQQLFDQALFLSGHLSSPLSLWTFNAPSDVPQLSELRLYPDELTDFFKEV